MVLFFRILFDFALGLVLFQINKEFGARKNSAGKSGPISKKTPEVAPLKEKRRVIITHMRLVLKRDCFGRDQLRGIEEKFF
ncbi:hypothetical protein NPIL_240041 [Nephila pilipes]|uniref:Uncharacterized protein n=1 Tax=Nephila pilipes TaxID=299642 RepID=A0A8X6PX91_NEPPI|nr:hypothetical protein NPIL_240041 [Nephila pilipes]